MSHNSTASPGSGGDTFLTVDLALATYPSTGKATGCVLYWSTDATTAPTPLTTAHPLPISDAGGSLTVDGTVAFSNSTIAVTNAGTFAVQAAQSGTWTVGISAAQTLATVTTVGTVTTITNVVHVDDNSGSLTVDGTVAFSNTTIAVTNAGTFAVQVSSALPAGTNAIGKLAANDGVDIGDVTINNASGGSAVNIQDGGNSITVDGTVAFSNSTIAVTNTGTFAVQAAQSGTWTVGLSAAQTLATVTTVGTVTTITNVVHVDDNSGSLTVDNAGTFAVQATLAAAATNIAKAEDVASADADVGVPAMYVRKATPANTSGTDGDYEFGQISNGRQWVESAGMTETIGTVSSAAVLTNMPVDTTLERWVSVQLSGTWVGTNTFQCSNDNTNWVSLALINSNSGNTQASATSTANGVFHGPNPAKYFRVNCTAYTSGTVTATVETSRRACTPITMGIGTVIVGVTSTALGKAEDAVHGSGDTGVAAWAVANEAQTTLAADGDYIGQAADTAGNRLVVGNIAHDGVDAKAPVKVGAKATASVLGATPVAAADRTDLFAGTDGVLIVRDGTSLEDIISDTKTNTDAASTAMTGAFAATASQRIYLTDICLSNSSATFITVDIRDGAAGAVLFTFPVPATSGVVHSFKTPLRFTANTALAFDGSAAATTLTCSVVGYKSKT